jgi:hypothetical protein
MDKQTSVKMYLWYLPKVNLLFESRHKGKFKYVYELVIGDEVIVDTVFYIGEI